MLHTEIRPLADPMLLYPGRKLRSHPDIQRPAIAIGHDVNPTTVPLAIHAQQVQKNRAPGQARGDVKYPTQLLT